VNASDASNPKFDPGWWNAHKASSADPKGDFANALRDYQKARDDLFSESKMSRHPDVAEVKKQLERVKAQAGVEKARLGTFQKETVTALGSYVHKVDAAQQELSRLGTAPIMKDPVKVLVKQAPQFAEYCKKNLQSESFNFLNLRYKSPVKERCWYDDFIKPGSKFEINIANVTRAPFNEIASAVDKGAKPNTPATWDKAPWDKAVSDIEKLLENDVARRFRHYMTGVMMTGKLP